MFEFSQIFANSMPPEFKVLTNRVSISHKYFRNTRSRILNLKSENRKFAKKSHTKISECTVINKPPHGKANNVVFEQV